MTPPRTTLSWLRQLTGRAPASATAAAVLDSAAIARLFARATRGEAAARRDLGQAYLRGEGVPRSPAEAARWLSLAAEDGDADARLLLAVMHLQGLGNSSQGGLFGVTQAAPDPGAAAALALAAAESGQAEAMALFAFLCTTGQGTPRDLGLAGHWYARAAEAGDARGKLGLGMLRLTGDDGVTDKPLAVRLISEAADAGVPTAIYMLGTLHEAAVPPLAFDEARAAELYRKSAEAGVRPACARLGLALLKGWGVPANAIEGETWLRRAALNGDTEAAALVGDLHAAPADGLPNHVEAYGWYRLAAEGGHRQAMRCVGLMALEGRGAPQDPQEAMTWLGRAMDAGDTAAAADLGQMLRRFGPESAEAMRVADTFERAALAGSPIAAFNFAVCLQAGLGRAMDGPRAAELMRQAGEGGVVNALFWHGRMLMDGSAGRQDTGEGLSWIARAAAEGMPEAQALLDAEAGTEALPA